MTDATPLPDHIAETVDAVEELHLKHREHASRFELITEQAARFLGRPVCLAALSVLTLGWLVAVLRGAAGALNWLEPALTVFAVYMTLLILAGQRRQERLANLREQLTLQLALVNEAKAGKIIALIEELRRDSPSVQNRNDPEATAMAAKVDTTQVADAVARIEDN